MYECFKTSLWFFMIVIIENTRVIMIKGVSASCVGSKKLNVLTEHLSS